jgi:hypothetical protein
MYSDDTAYMSVFSTNSKTPRSNISSIISDINTAMKALATKVDTNAFDLKSLFDTNKGAFNDSPFKTNLFQDYTNASLATKAANILKVQQSLSVPQPTVTLGANTIKITSAIYGSNNVTGLVSYLVKQNGGTGSKIYLVSKKDVKFGDDKPHKAWNIIMNSIFGMPYDNKILPLTVSYTINGVSQTKTLTTTWGDLASDINIDCAIGWGACDAASNSRTGTQTWSVTTQPFGGGAACPTVVSKPDQACTVTPVDCVGSFGDWTPCIDGQHSRVYSVKTEALHGGAACPNPNGFMDTQACTPAVNCVGAWDGWGSCVNGSQTRTYSITTPADNGGAPCSNTAGQTQTQKCTSDATTVTSDGTETGSTETFWSQYKWWLVGGGALLVILLVLFFMMRKGPKGAPIQNTTR